MLFLPANQVSAVVLGVMQDGGLPHIGCRCPRCAAAYADPRLGDYVACLGLVDTRGDRPGVWLIDATPDIRQQLNLLADLLSPGVESGGRLRQPDGLFLTHAHMGHTGGLVQLGPEAMDVQRIPVYAAIGLIGLLNEARLWRPLTQNLGLIPLSTNRPVALRPDLRVTPVPIPHRDEWGIGTFAFHIQGPEKTMLYMPDLDTWELWAAADMYMGSVDYALVDGTFYSMSELDGRSLAAHPLIPHTLDLYGDIPGQLTFIHFNHTNPVLDEDSEERATVLADGVQLAYTGQIFAL